MANQYTKKVADKKVAKPATQAMPAKAITAQKPSNTRPTKTTVTQAKAPNTVATKPSAPTNASASKTSVRLPAKPATKPVSKSKPSAIKKVSKSVTSATLSANNAAPVKPVAKKLNKKSTEKKETKKQKTEKIKMERDSFTMPKDEYAQLSLLKARLISMGHPVKKSELLRAGIKLLTAMSDSSLKTTMQKIPVIKTGRPKKKD